MSSSFEPTNPFKGITARPLTDGEFNAVIQWLETHPGEVLKVNDEAIFKCKGCNVVVWAVNVKISEYNLCPKCITHLN